MVTDPEDELSRSGGILGSLSGKGGRRRRLLGYYVAPWAYAQLQVLEQAIEATMSLDHDRLADYIRAAVLKTVVGDVSFGAQGEWGESRVLEVQFQHIKGSDIGQFKDISTQVVLMH